MARHLVLPALALSLRYLALIARITRTSMIGVLGAEFILAARARGASERVVLIGHALRNAAAPVITVIGFNRGFRPRRLGADRDGVRLARNRPVAVRLDLQP